MGRRQLNYSDASELQKGLYPGGEARLKQFGDKTSLISINAFDVFKIQGTGARSKDRSTRRVVVARYADSRLTICRSGWGSVGVAVGKGGWRMAVIEKCCVIIWALSDVPGSCAALSGSV